MKTLSKIQHIHCIGIGGIGMSALARLLRKQGKTISGSDSTDSSLISELKNEGMSVKIGHHAKNLPKNADLVVYSNAIPEDNPEMLEAKHQKIPLLSYFEALGKCTQGVFTIAVCGTHGKSTTTALLSLGLIAAGYDPSVIIGTKLREFDNKNMRKGADPLFVVEACEYRRAFLHLHPSLIIITNMEAEHLDYYRDFADYTDAFRSFIKKLPSDGILVFPYDDETVRALANEYKGEKWSFGREKTADVRLERDKVIINKGQGRRDCFVGRPSTGSGRPSRNDRISLQIPGEHNRKNALAALTGIIVILDRKIALRRSLRRMSALKSLKTEKASTLNYKKRRCTPLRSVRAPRNDRMNAPIRTIFSAFHDYQGAWRRFEYRGEFQGAKVYDDYAHHPTEIRATLSGARELFPKNRIITVFQPHQFNRTKNLFNNFAKAFQEADIVIIPNIYEVRDQKEDTESTSAEALVKAIKKNNPNVEYTQNFQKTVNFLKKNIHKGNILIIMGAGDVYKITESLLMSSSTERSPLTTASDRGSIEISIV